MKKATTSWLQQQLGSGKTAVLVERIINKVIKNKTSDLKAYEEKIKKLIDIENPTRELLQTIVDKIIIDKDKNVEIIYKFSVLD